MRSDQSTIDVKFIFELNVFTCHGESIDTNPFSDRILPTNYRTFNETESSNLGALHNCGVVDALTRTDCDSSSDDHIRTEFSCGVNLC